MAAKQDASQVTTRYMPNASEVTCC